MTNKSLPHTLLPLDKMSAKKYMEQLATISRFPSKIFDLLPIDHVPDDRAVYHSFCFSTTTNEPKVDNDLQSHHPKALYLALQELEEEYTIYFSESLHVRQ